MAVFDFPAPLWASRSSEADAHAAVLTGERKRERDLRLVADLNLAARKRKRSGKFAQEPETRVVVLPSIRPQHARSRTVVDCRVLEPIAHLRGTTFTST
jgi:hypothetical protein